MRERGSVMEMETLGKKLEIFWAGSLAEP